MVKSGRAKSSRAKSSKVKRSTVKTGTVKTKVRRAAQPAREAVRQARPRREASVLGPLFAPVPDATLKEIGGVQVEVGRAGAARVKRIIYPPGFHWAVDMKPLVGSDLCMHAHVGFLASGEIHIEYPDGCVVEHRAPQIVAIEPGHDGWVVGKEPAVLIEFDFEGDTLNRLGMPTEHRHA
jgi:hypothetical protein